MMRTGPIALSLIAVPVLFIGGPLLATSCTGNGGGDGGIDSAQNGPCQNGTIQLVDCEPDEAGVQIERFTDEACDGLDTAETRSPVIHDDTQAPAVDMPTEGQVIPNSPPFTFVFHPTGLAFAPRAAPTFRAFAWSDDIARWASLLPSAEAHCAPFGGVGFALIFSANGQTLFRAETANHSYTPTADAWSRLLAATGTITLDMEAALFSDNVVTEGPYDNQTPRHFSIMH